MEIRNIILVGPDGCGKSTLAQDLSASLLYPVYHGMGRHPNKVARTLRMLNWSNVIFDRVYAIDETVYSRALGFTPEENMEPYLRLYKNPKEYIILYVTNKNMESILDSRGDEDVKSHELQLIKAEYDKLLVEFPNVVHVEMDFSNYDNILKDLITKLR